MSASTKKVIVRVVPVLFGVAVGYWPHAIAALESYGGWYAVAGAALTLIGQEVYHRFIAPKPNG